MLEIKCEAEHVNLNFRLFDSTSFVTLCKIRILQSLEYKYLRTVSKFPQLYSQTVLHSQQPCMKFQERPYRKKITKTDPTSNIHDFL